MTDYLYQIQLIEIAKYLNDEDVCVFQRFILIEIHYPT